MRSRSLVLLGMILACCMAYGQQGQAPSSLPTVQVVSSREVLVPMKEPARNPSWIVGHNSLTLVWETTKSLRSINISDYFLPVTDKQMREGCVPKPDPKVPQPPDFGNDIHNPQEPRLELRYVTLVYDDKVGKSLGQPKVLSVPNWGSQFGGYQYPGYAIVNDGKHVILRHFLAWMTSDAFGTVNSQDLFQPLLLTMKKELTISLPKSEFTTFPPQSDDRTIAAKGFESAYDCAFLCDGNHWLALWQDEKQKDTNTHIFPPNNSDVVLFTDNTLNISQSFDGGKTWQSPYSVWSYSCEVNEEHYEKIITPTISKIDDNYLLIATGPYSISSNWAFQGGVYQDGKPGWYDDFPVDEALDYRPDHPCHGSLVYWLVPHNFTKLPDYTTLISNEDVTGYNVTSDGKQNIYVAYTRGSDFEHGSLWLIASHDGGAIWANPEQLTDGSVLDRFPAIAVYHGALYIAFIRSEHQKPSTVCYLRKALPIDSGKSVGK